MVRIASGICVGISGCECGEPGPAGELGGAPQGRPQCRWTGWTGIWLMACQACCCCTQHDSAHAPMYVSPGPLDITAAIMDRVHHETCLVLHAQTPTRL